MQTQSLIQFIFNNSHALLEQTTRHLFLAISATLMATLIGVPLGIFITRKPILRSTILGATSIFQTIPSLALLAFLIPLLGIGAKPTIIALTIYGILPITRNTNTGILGIPTTYIEAANGLGFTPWQRLFKIEVPLALPVIIAGIRTATAMAIGITTIAAFIGAGGLGVFITQGLALDNSRLILLGAIPAALLALIVDYLIAHVEHHFTVRGIPRKKKRIALWLTLIAFMLIALTIGRSIKNTFFATRKNTIVIASKNFTEQFILANIISDLIKAKTNLHVEEKLNLGSTTLLQNALLKGAIDLYPEYTGTAYLIVLKNKKALSARQTYNVVKNEYQRKFNLTWLKPFGFYNSQTLAIPQAFAKKHHITTLSQLAKFSGNLSVAATASFLKRPDGLPGLAKTYHFKFKNIQQMQPDLMYRAIKSHDVDIIEVFTTDARIKTYHLVALKDNKRMYPPYYAAPIIRTQTLQEHPKLKKVINLLAGRITNTMMQHMNYEVDAKKLTPQMVALNFLKQQHLL